MFFAGTQGEVLSLYSKPSRAFLNFRHLATLNSKKICCTSKKNKIIYISVVDVVLPAKTFRIS